MLGIHLDFRKLWLIFAIFNGANINFHWREITPIRRITLNLINLSPLHVH